VAVKKPLGEILLERGLIDADQLARALAEVRARPGLRLGDVLVQEGVLDESQIARALAEQFQLPYADLEDLEIDPRVARLIGEGMARSQRVLPLREERGRLVVATADPLNAFALDEIAFVTGKPVDPVVVTQEVLTAAIDYAHGHITQLPRRAGSRVTPPGAGTRETPAREVIGREPGRGREPVPEGLARPATVEPVAEGAAVRIVQDLLARAVARGASDIHIEPGEHGVRVRYRVDGFLQPAASVTPDQLPSVVSRIKILAGMDIAEKRLPQDGRFSFQEGGRSVDVRVATLPTIFGEKVALRLLDKAQAITRLEGLGFSPADLEKWGEIISKPYGMILVTGPTGSGKTTTLTATLHRLNREDVHIVTIEDPVEYQIPGINQMEVNPRAGLTFAVCLRAVLRQDPNIIMVGEIRDEETAQIAVRAALTGHLVLSTLHTNDAPGTLSRLLDMGVEPFLVASSVIGVVSQRLARRLCPACSEPFTLPEGAPERWSMQLPSGPLSLRRAKGCPDCGYTGFRGRIALFELMPVTREIRELVASRASSDEIRQVAAVQGMRSLLQDGVDKALAGLTTLEEVQRVAFSGA
jgi:type IV pilus assembly protein PilB